MDKLIEGNTILNCVNDRKNIYCERAALTNEASVETFFVTRMLADLGYKDSNIKTKNSIENFLLSKGSKKVNYKPDYTILSGGKPVLIVDAKSTTENIDDCREQCAHYCLILNRGGCEVRYFLLTNGISTKLYEWDTDLPTLVLDFTDFFISNTKYEALHNLISSSSIKRKNTISTENLIKLKRINKEEAQKLFISCHKLIWNQEKRSPNSAFIEFVKLIFVKLYNDKRIHNNYGVNDDGFTFVPKEENTFSTYWIESRERETSNPINDIQFKSLMESWQDEVTKFYKKTIFYDGERIELKPSTIKTVVKKLENVDLFGIDEDLNGRLFETFLNATMRGKALGQFFTPRSVVLLGTLMADLEVSEKHIDKVLDGSCGSGGFLIEALSVMRNKVKENNSYSQEKKIDLITKISNECLFGIDAAVEPNLAKIARINMYLHGDGGSHIYCADGLDKQITIEKTESPSVKAELYDMKTNILPNSFDVVLTNPPFSMWYELKDEVQKKIVNDYKLLIIDKATNKRRNRLRTSAMFLERYKDLLKIGGKLISVIDETILASNGYSYVRDFIRKHFIIKAVVSLHGDAFNMSCARVKTALVYLQKKKNQNEQQPACFMYSSIYLGVDDLPITTQANKIVDARKRATEEIEYILQQFKKFQKGEKGVWYVAPDKLTERLDVKSCVNLQGRYVPTWEAKGYQVFSIGELCQKVDKNNQRIKPKDFPEESFRILTIGFDGRCRAEETRLGKHINYSTMIVLKEGDLVFSEYGAFRGGIGYVTQEFDGCLASNSYTVVKCNDGNKSIYLWSILRTTEIKADLLTSAIGMGRQTINWDNIKQIKLPLLSEEEIGVVTRNILEAWDKEKQTNQIYENVQQILHQRFLVESEESKIRFLQAKPPK